MKLTIFRIFSKAVLIISVCCILSVTLISCSKNMAKQSQEISSSIGTTSVIAQTTNSKPEKSTDKENEAAQQTNKTTGTKQQESTQTVSSNSNSQPGNVRTSDKKSDFKEIREVPDKLIGAVGFEAVKYYQCGDTIYLLTYTGPKKTELTMDFRRYPYYGCSEVWTYNTKTEKCKKLFVKYDYDFGNSRQNNSYHSPQGCIASIDSIDTDGNVFFTESWNEGMEHYGTRKFEYLSDDKKIITLSFEAGRPEILTADETKKICQEVFTSEILNTFYEVSLIIDKDNGKSTFEYYTGDLLYAVRYNLRKEDGTYYHEIDRYDIKSGKCTPVIQKILIQKDEEPLILVNSIDKNGNITIQDWCSFHTSKVTHQIYLYKPAEGTITLQSGTGESGKYIIVVQ